MSQSTRKRRSARPRQSTGGGSRFRPPPWLAAAFMLAVVVPMVVAQNAPAPRDAGAPGAAAQAAAAPQTQPAEGGKERSLLEWYLAGGIFIHPIALCSFVGVAIAIERFVSLRRSAAVPPGLLPGLRGAVRDLNSDREAGLQYLAANDSPMARVLAAGIKKAPRGPEAVEKAIEDAGAIEAGRLRRNMRMLNAIASVSTLLGLIGTIQGMIIAFMQVEASGTTGNFKVLASGIYTALITTFAGLAVAIPITILYYYFAGRIEAIVTDMNDAATEFVESYTAGAAGGPHRVAAAAPPFVAGAATPVPPGVPAVAGQSY